jgi:hypothetical protein
VAPASGLGQNIKNQPVIALIWQLGQRVRGLGHLRCSRVVGQISPEAFQNPSAPSAIASSQNT